VSTLTDSKALLAVTAALDKKGTEPVLLDVSHMTGYTDSVLLVSGGSERQVDAIARGVEELLREHGHRPLGTEGAGHGQWILLDYGDLIVHVFYHPVREQYDLERLWSEAPRVRIEAPAPTRVAAAAPL
jgi:ribosome-associated protein